MQELRPLDVAADTVNYDAIAARNELFDKQIVGYRGYMGNRLLKRAGVKTAWTEEMIAEYLRCQADPIYFIETYLRIIHVDRGLVPFILYPYQKQIIQTVIDSSNTIVTTSRQAGKTSSIVGFTVWYMIFHPDKNIAILANKGATGREILGRVQTAYQHLPKWLQVGVVEWNKGSVQLENNSRVLAGATSDDNLRGYSFNVIIIDEAAHIDHWDAFFASVYPTISSGSTTKLVLISTPFGLNHFYEIWSNAKKGKNGYKHVEVGWWDVPGRDEAWKLKTLASLNFDQAKFDQEYCNEFQGSSGTLIAGWKLKQLSPEIPHYLKDETGGGSLKQYVPRAAGRRYAMTADVSEGKGLDYSAFVVFDVTEMPYRVVMTYRGNQITPTDFAELIHRTCVMYNEAVVLVEYENMGPVVVQHLFSHLEYENILSTAAAGNLGKKVTAGFGGKNTDRGLKMSKAVKMNGCSLLKLLVEQDHLLIPDAAAISELSTFSKKNSGYEAEEGKNDDLVMCLVVFAWLSNQKYFNELTDVDTLRRIRDMSDDDMTNSMVPFGFVTEPERPLRDGVVEFVDDFERWLRE